MLGRERLAVRVIHACRCGYMLVGVGMYMQLCV